MITYIIIALTVFVSLTCFNNRQLFEKLALNPYCVIHRHEWYRLSHMGLFTPTPRTFCNMFTYWSFGTYIEKVFEAAGWGTLNYLLLYFGAMIIASLPDVIKYRNAAWYRSIGASGAVSAILFTSIFLNPWDKILLFAAIPVPGIVFGVIYLIYCQYMAKRGGDNINHNAHFFGAVYGFIFPLFMNPRLWDVFLRHF